MVLQEGNIVAIAFGLKEVALRLLPIRILASGLGIVLSALLVGCVYIPPFAEDDAGVDPASFKVGTTLRQEVLDVLGDPLIDDGRFIVDELQTV
jgi:hypothetical protein